MEVTKTEVIHTDKPQEPVLIPNENSTVISDLNRTSNDKNNDCNNGKSLKENKIEDLDEINNKDIISHSNEEFSDKSQSNGNNTNKNTVILGKTTETSEETNSNTLKANNEDKNDNLNLIRNDQNIINQTNDKGESYSKESIYSVI